MNFLFFYSEYYVNECVCVCVFFFFFFVFNYYCWDLGLMPLLARKCYPNLNKACNSARPLENVGFTVGNPRSPLCVMALSNIYDDVGVSVFPKRLVRGPKRS